MKSAAYGLLVLLALGASSCINLFDPLDTPTNDQQLLQAARDCFDDGNLTCAREYYNKLPASMSDYKNSELAFAILDEQGATMAAFTSAFGSGGSGGGITSLANAMTAGAGKSKRLALYGAYQYVSAIQSTELRGFVRFVTSMILMAEVLAESSGGNNSLEQSDYVANRTSCVTTANTVLACTTGAAVCGAGTGSLTSSGSQFTLDDSDASTSTSKLNATNPTVQMLDAAITKAQYALNNEISAGGKFGSGIGSITSTVLTYNGTAAVTLNSGQCFRALMLSVSIGAAQ